MAGYSARAGGDAAGADDIRGERGREKAGVERIAVASAFGTAKCLAVIAVSLARKAICMRI
jgi:hypothetical protein